jgi:DNA-binding response OmpR family regulator
MKTILLIEDNAFILENLGEYLEIEGYKILLANSGKKGLALARKYLPDLIICDVLMPKMDGHEVLRLLLDTDRTSEIPFVFSTSMAEKNDQMEAIKLGADDYIVKPFQIETLLEVAKKCMRCGSKRHNCTFSRLKISLYRLQLKETILRSAIM